LKKTAKDRVLSEISHEDEINRSVVELYFAALAQEVIEPGYGASIREMLDKQSVIKKRL